MKLAIMQPYFMPYIGYFQLINSVDKFIIYDDVNYIKRGWINRNRFLINSTPKLLSVPLKNASQNKLILDININDQSLWKTKFLKSINLAYKKAPYFDEVYALIEDVFQCNNNNLSFFVANSIVSICRYLGIGTDIVLSSAIYNNAELSGQQRIIDICLREKASVYINPINGTELYDNEIFNQNGIELKFIKSDSFEYQQFGSEFHPWLSIIDVMMFNSPSEINDFLKKYRLI
ncbi:WbqC family protein [Vibrio sp. RE86]|uniref:WbqC family protein n=1 Tax=Vibrio sp. RE86 TaxID=2607605 RepID=UPI001493D0AF|nr:WbqC family protein [Vibrio sp. RE86]NOH80822.1 WbqC family protein [Vibrio sp. RE86]